MAFGPDRDIRIRKVANGFIVSHDRDETIRSVEDGSASIIRALETVKEIAETEEDVMTIVKKRMKTL